MTEAQIIKKLDKAWEMEDGFFYEIRNRKLNLEKGVSLHRYLQIFQLNEDTTISRKLVRLLWYIPIYLEYQKDTLKSVLDDRKYSEYVRLTNSIQAEIERLLGYP